MEMPVRTMQAPPLKRPVKQAEAVKWDFSKMSAPENLEESRVEEVTIDGICGVY